MALNIWISFLATLTTGKSKTKQNKKQTTKQQKTQTAFHSLKIQTRQNYSQFKEEKKNLRESGPEGSTAV